MMNNRTCICFVAFALIATNARAAPTVKMVKSPIERVLVYSDQARVFRSASVVLRGGRGVAQLATLPDTARRATLRVECRTAKVERVTVVRAWQHRDRQQEAKALLKRFETVSDALRKLADRGGALRSELLFVDALSAGPAPKRKEGPQPGVFVGAWQGILVWGRNRTARLRQQLLALADKRQKLQRKLHKIRTEAKGLDLDRISEPSWQVVATLRGASGRHKVTLSYLVPDARWIPSYDLRYEPRTRTVEAAYYALVRQGSGEDWARSKLRFSTAQPTLLLAIPQLPTWTMGRKRDFMPRPRPRHEPAVRPWQPPRPARRVAPIVARLRAVLAGRKDGRDRTLDGAISGHRDRGGRSYGRRSGVRRPRKSPARVTEYKKRKKYDFDGDIVQGELQRPDGEFIDSRRSPSPAVAPSKPSPDHSGFKIGRTRLQQAGERLPWNDVGYSPPALDPDLPASAAKGYRFTLFAPGQHSVSGDSVDRRVPLMRKRLAVKALHRILPGRSKAAYLVGVLRNNTGKPILRGHANLFAGRMFTGRSWINTALPGKTLRLPLGIDDHVKVERHARQRTLSKGVVFKDDVSEYTVTIEIANNHRYAIEVELEDQLPVPVGKKVTVKGFTARPKMRKPDKAGRVRWTGKVVGGSVKKLSFTFKIVRPKDWELHQHGG